MAARAARSSCTAPVSFYEVHLGSWMRVPEDGNRSLTYREAAPKLVEYVTKLGFTQRLPRTERFFERCLMLPMNMMVTEDDARYVADRVRNFYGA